MTGTGQSGQKSFALYHDYVNYGGIQVGSTSNANQGLFVQPRPEGSLPVTLSNLSITGTNASEFTITIGQTGNDRQLGTAYTQYCYVYVQFAPLAEGLRTATLQLTDNATGSTQDVTLIGDAYVEGSSITAYSYTDFGRIPLDTTSSQSAAYFQNNTAAAVTLHSRLPPPAHARPEFNFPSPAAPATSRSTPRAWNLMTRT